MLKLQRERKLSEGAVTEAVRTLHRDLSVPLFKQDDEVKLASSVFADDRHI